MKSVIKSAKSVEEAVDLGLKDLSLTRDEVEIEILEQPKKGLFGIIGSRDAIVKIKQKFDFKIDINDIYAETENNKVIEENKDSLKEENFKKKKLEVETKVKSEVRENNDSNINIKEIEKDLVDKLLHIVSSIHLTAKVKSKVENNHIYLELYDISEEDTGIVIGRKGETLDSIQYILSLMANSRENNFCRVTLDVAKYRERRREAIENNARKVAFKVLKNKKAIALEPMNSYERRIVHYALQNYKELETVSQGNFPNRKVVIKYKG